MSRGLLLTLTYALVLVGIALLQGDIVALAVPLLAAVALGLADAPAPPRLRASRSVAPDRAAQGQPVEVAVTVTNDGPALREVALRDALPAGLELVDGRAELLASLGPGERAELRYTVRGQRGLYTFGDVRAAARDRLGLFEREAAVAAPARLFVLPEVVRLRQIAVRPRRTRVYAGSIPARQGGAGIEFFGVRGYQPGDTLRHINARLSARPGDALFVNEFEQERVADVGIILDARDRSDVRGPAGPGDPRGSLFERGVQAAAALADGLLAQGNRVGMLVYGDAIAWTFPGYGKVQREKIMRSLATATPGDRLALETLDAIPARLFPPRSLLILISPLLAEDVRAVAGLRARGYQLVVISPDPVAFERAALGPGEGVELGVRLATVEREMLLARLRAAGVPVVSWPPEVPLAQVAAQALARLPLEI